MNTSITTPADAIHTSHNPRSGRAARMRNAMARRKLERRLDKKLLRMHLTEVWNDAVP